MLLEGYNLKNSKAISVTAIALLAFGLTACSGASEDAVVETGGNKIESEPVEQESGQTVAEACTELAGPLSNSFEVILESAQDVTKPENLVAIYTELAVSFEDASSGVLNKEVKEATREVHQDLVHVRDETKKVYVDNDTSKMEHLVEDTTKLQNSMTTLTTLCS